MLNFRCQSPCARYPMPSAHRPRHIQHCQQSPEYRAPDSFVIPFDPLYPRPVHFAFLIVKTADRDAVRRVPPRPEPELHLRDERQLATVLRRKPINALSKDRRQDTHPYAESNQRQSSDRNDGPNDDAGPPEEPEKCAAHMPTALSMAIFVNRRQTRAARTAVASFHPNFLPARRS